MPSRRRPDGERRRELLVVFDDQHAHLRAARSLPRPRLQRGNSVRYGCVTGRSVGLDGMTRFLCLALALAALPLAGCGGSKDPDNPSSSARTRATTSMAQVLAVHALARPAELPRSRAGERRRHLAQLEEGQRPRSELAAVQGGGDGVPEVRAQARQRQADPRRGAAAVPALLAVHAHARRAAVPRSEVPGGGVQLRMPRGLGPDSPSIKAAQKACKSLQPGGMVGKSGGKQHG